MISQHCFSCSLLWSCCASCSNFMTVVLERILGRCLSFSGNPSKMYPRSLFSSINRMEQLCGLGSDSNHWGDIGISCVHKTYLWCSMQPHHHKGAQCDAMADDNEVFNRAVFCVPVECAKCLVNPSSHIESALTQRHTSPKSPAKIDALESIIWAKWALQILYLLEVFVFPRISLLYPGESLNSIVTLIRTLPRELLQITQTVARLQKLWVWCGNICQPKKICSR